MTSTVPVVIVSAGPTGVTAATLLAQYGIECLVLDRWENVYPQPPLDELTTSLEDPALQLPSDGTVVPASAAGKPGPD